MTLLPVKMFLVVFLNTKVIFRSFCTVPTVMTFLVTLFITFLRGGRLDFGGGVRMVTGNINRRGVVAVDLVFLYTKKFSNTIATTNKMSDAIGLKLSLVPTRFTITNLFLVKYFVSISVKASVKAVTTLTPVTIKVDRGAKFMLDVYVKTIIYKTVFKSGLSVVSSAAVTTIGARKYRVGSGFGTGFFVILPTTVVAMLVF